MRCPDCDSVDRRQFLKTTALGTAGAAVAAAGSKKAWRVVRDARNYAVHQPFPGTEIQSGVCLRSPAAVESR